MEGRNQLEGIPSEGGTGWTQSRAPLLPHLQRVNEAAQRGRQTQFTTLLHHVDVAALRRAFARLKRDASAGVDEQTAAQYAQALDENLAALKRRSEKGLTWGRFRELLGHFPLPRPPITRHWQLSGAG